MIWLKACDLGRATGEIQDRGRSNKKTSHQVCPPHYSKQSSKIGSRSLIEWEMESGIAPRTID